MRQDPDRQAMIDEAVKRFRESLEKRLPDDKATLDQIEDAIDDIGKDVLPDLQEKLANKRAKKPRNNQVCCPCGAVARYRNMGTRTLITKHGLFKWRRPTYYCNTCHKGYSPLDGSLGLDRGETTRAVREYVAAQAPSLGFVETKAVLIKLRNVDLSASTVERIAVSIGSSLRKAQKQEAIEHHEDRLLDRRTATPKRLYIGADGLMTPLREAWRRDGSLGPLACRYGECKTGVVYEAFTDAAGKDRRVKTHAYTATLEGVETFELLLGTLAHRCGHHAANEVVVLGDGAIWIWYMFGRLFPSAIQILDFYHACDHVRNVADAMHGRDTDAGREWQAKRRDELRSNRVSDVIKAIAAWVPASHGDREIQRIESGYFTDNSERMRYKTYIEKGYHIGSGVVEAACKHVVAQRLDQAGMHWTTAPAEAIVALRASSLSTQPTDLRPHLAMAA